MKNVFITGISRGIGKALSSLFLQHGYQVYGTVKRFGSDELKNDNLTIFEMDLTRPESIDHVCAEVSRKDITIDMLINNAGALFDDDETTVVIDKLRKTLEVNLIGTIDLTEHILPMMKEGSHIINVSSTAGSLKLMDSIDNSHFPYHYPSYKISKSALNMYTRILARRFEHEKRNIIVSSIHPGWVKTDIGGEDANITPEEAAKAIFDLAESRPVSGKFWEKGQEIPW